MQALLMSALLAVVLLSRIQEPRRFGNGVLLGLIAVCAVLGTVSAVGHFAAPAAGAVTAAVAGAVWLSGLVAAALLVANGVTMVRREGTRPASLLSLLAGAALLGLLALLLSATYLSVRVLRAAAGAAVLLGGYGAFLLLCFLGYTLLYRRLAPRPGADYLVVLGAGLDGCEVPPLLASRLDRAVALYRAEEAAGHTPLLLVTGGKGPHESCTEASAMADYLIAAGCPRERIRREEKATNTTENLAFSRELMERERPGYHCTVVTSSFHVLRSAVTTRRAGVPGQVVGAPTAGYYWPSAVLREVVATALMYPRVNTAAVLLLTVAGAWAGWQW
ncbi:YdcF family protein [Kitasatospora sp. NPDC091207]|uniref:YdcF family protein n=1 Tax=Kitasatospora sp. NPDC091207 TaxID=3364083 RepID=UPI00381AE3AE